MDGFTISLKLLEFQSKASAIITVGEELRKTPTDLPEIKGQSEVITDYIKCYQEMQQLLANYKQLVIQDMERIQNIAKATVEMENELLKPIEGRQ